MSSSLEKLQGYSEILTDVTGLLEMARKASARVVNSLMTATYWEIGRRIVESEQGGEARAEYGKALIEKLSADLMAKFGRGFTRSNLFQIRAFYQAYPIVQTVSGQSVEFGKIQTASGLWEARLREISARFPLPWSHYVKLLAVKNAEARKFYETESFRSGWSVRQLDRQINTQFYERTALSRNKAVMLRKGGEKASGDLLMADDEIRDPFVLEFLNLKDEYSENDLEQGLIHHLEHFLLELGGDFAFIGRQRRLRIDDEWYRVDLLFFHRALRCLVIIDLKLGKFGHADAGQMHLYLNYAREHWMREGENPPVGLILCAQKGNSLAKYALEGLPNKIVAREYLTALPKEKLLAAEIEKTRQMLAGKPASK